MKRNVCFLFVYLILGCNSNDSFYTDYIKDDLSRLPLIKPYELINVLAKEHGDNDSWQLNLIKSYKTEKGLSLDFLNVSLININAGIIFGGPGKYKTYPDFWFIINTIKKPSEEMIFKNEKDWKVKLTEFKVSYDTLYHIWPIFETFKNNQKLPW